MNPRMHLFSLGSLFVLLGSIAVAQETAGPHPPNALPSNLDQMIATALKSSPDVLLAEAKVRQAQAELHQARLKVARDVVTAFNEKKQQQALFEVAARGLQDMQKVAEAGAVSKPEVDQARLRASEAELGAAQTDATLRYLLGIGSQHESDPFGRASATEVKPETRPRPVRISEPFIQSLKRPVSGPFENTTLADLVKRLSDQGNVSILIDNKGFMDQGQLPVSIPLQEPVTLSAVFHALADQYDVCFLFRDYGILVTNGKRARNISAPAIPDSIPLHAEAR
jgi:hypothetical protein